MQGSKKGNEEIDVYSRITAARPVKGIASVRQLAASAGYGSSIP